MPNGKFIACKIDFLLNIKSCLKMEGVNKFIKRSRLTSNCEAAFNQINNYGCYNQLSNPPFLIPIDFSAMPLIGDTGC